MGLSNSSSSESGRGRSAPPLFLTLAALVSSLFLFSIFGSSPDESPATSVGESGTSTCISTSPDPQWEVAMENFHQRSHPQSHFPPSENRTQSSQNTEKPEARLTRRITNWPPGHPELLPARRGQSPPRTRSTGRQITSTLRRKKRQRNDR